MAVQNRFLNCGLMPSASMKDNMDNGRAAEECVVCFKDIKICSIMDCQHTICHECSTRLRVLCNKLECPICRQETTIALFSSQPGSFSSLYRRSLYSEDRYKLAFEDERARQAFDRLLAHSCPRCAQRRPFATFRQLRDHVTREHGLFYCDLCIKHLKLFNKERKLYTWEHLEDHQNWGDADDSSYRGHPLCPLCHHRFIDEEELILHRRRDHFYCHLCDADGHELFYQTYQELQGHFRREHYLCEDGECREKKFIVFRTNIDLQAHRASAHSAASAAAPRRGLGSVLTLQFSTVQSRRQRNDRCEPDAADLGRTMFDDSPPPPATYNVDSRLEFPSLNGAVRRPTQNAERVGGWSSRDADLSAPGDGSPSAFVVNVSQRPARTDVTINVSRRPAAPAAAAAAAASPPPQGQPRILQVASSGNITMQSPTMEQPPRLLGGRVVRDLEAAYRRPEPPEPPEPPDPPPAGRLYPVLEPEPEPEPAGRLYPLLEPEPEPEPAGPPSPPAGRRYAGTGSVRFSVGSVAGGGCKARLTAAADADAVTSSPGGVTSLLGLPPAAGWRYLEPDNFQARNGRLAKLSRELLRCDDLLRTFQQVSVEYRGGLLSGEDYYERCLALLGPEKLGRLFPELLVLLPDIARQTELLAAHEAFNGTGRRSCKFVSCPTCGQVLVFADLAPHSAQHCRAAEFPASLLP